MNKVYKTMDGNEATAYIAYAFTEVAAIYPITPSSPMAECVDVWSAKGKKNLFGQEVKLIEMQSEAGAAGTMHGSLETGALAVSFTSSQGLLLMIPTLYRLSGQLKPGVLHVSARTVGTHAFSIFGDHSDVMACRQTGLAMLCTGSVQENMDLSAVAHLAAIEGRVPFIHFFDGFRTSHEIQKVEVLDYEHLRSLLDMKALNRFRKSSLNPERPVLRSTVQNPDVFFQARESANPYYDSIPDIVEEYINKINEITGRSYGLFNYYGSEDADRMIIAMGSVSGVIRETVDYLNSMGEKTGYLEVHLYRPFSVTHFLREIPKTVKRISVLDRTKEPGAIGEPLYLDVCGALNEMKDAPEVYGGRYGLSSKDVTSDQIIAVFNNMVKDNPKNHFTIGINDDVTHHSLSLGATVDILPEGIKSLKFWGLGSDGTVGANKNSIKIIGDNTDKYVQAYFEYDTKKSGGVTKSHLRFGNEPIQSSYLVKNADFVACHQASFIKKYDIVNEIKVGGSFLLNCPWDLEELEQELPASVKRTLADKHIRFYIIDAVKISKEIGLGNRTNAILQAAFFKIADIIPIDEAVAYMKEAIKKTYGRKGSKVVDMNCKAVEIGTHSVKEISVPSEWSNAGDSSIKKTDVPDFVRKIAEPVNAFRGDSLPVSVFKGMEDGTVPLGTSAYEKRATAVDVPLWVADHCIQCNQCSFVCPHAALRPFLLTDEEKKNAPCGLETVPARGKGLESYSYRLQISPLDCLGCGVCINTCPSNSLEMRTITSQEREADNWEYMLSLSKKNNPIGKMTVKGSQFEQPLLEFSGACAGCGETAYMKLLTQLYGDRMIVANATGCTQAWGSAMPSFPYTVNSEGHGPAWSNSLFENNAEFALGMFLAEEQQRNRLKDRLEELETLCDENTELNSNIKEWLEGFSNCEKSATASKKLKASLNSALENNTDGCVEKICKEVLDSSEYLAKKSIWMYGGDGWAYDIGYGGLDHVLASGANVNILLVDTEVYSNTGGQASKSTPVGSVARFAASGKKTNKKDLGSLAMSYGNVYVAQVAMGANKHQLIKAIQEAEEYDGPSLVIAYAPCINHGLIKGMGFAQNEQKLAVDSGYWFLYRYNPELKNRGLNPFILDSKEPSINLKEFLNGEVRYNSLLREFPNEAEKLMRKAEEHAKEKYKEYLHLASQSYASACHQ